MLTAAIIGCGRVVQVGHLLGFKEVRDRIRAVAVADPVRENRDVVGEALDIPEHLRFADYGDLLGEVEFDFADQALPHFLHEEAIIACAEHGRHVLTEKPLTTSVERAAAIASAVKKAGIKFGIQHNYLHNPKLSAICTAIREGEIGRPIFIRDESFAAGHWPGAPGYDPDWRTRAEKAGGGALIDSGYHSLYMCEQFMGTRVTDVAARVCVTQEEGEVDDLSLVTLRHERGGISSVQMGWTFEVGQGILEVHGSEGSITQGEGGSVLLYRKQTGQWETYFEPDKKPSFRFTYSGSFLGFASALQADRQPEVGLEAALHNLAIILAAYESERTGSAISVTTLEHRMSASAALDA